MQHLTKPVETTRYGLVPISHAYYLGEHTDEDPLIFVDLHPFGTDLDHAHYPNPGRNHELTTEAISRALEFALDHHQTRWALLSNGLEMRLYRRGGSIARQYLKVDFVTLFAKEEAKDWLVFWGLFRLDAFLTTSKDETDEGNGASHCLLDKVIDESQRHATKIADDLRDNIVHAVENLLQGVIETSENHHFWNGEFNGKKVPDETQLKALFEESVYFLYRLLFVLYAESRDLLPIGESNIYKDGYSLDHLRYMAENSSDQKITRRPIISRRYVLSSLCSIVATHSVIPRQAETEAHHEQKVQLRFAFHHTMDASLILSAQHSLINVRFLTELCARLFANSPSRTPSDVAISQNGIPTQTWALMTWLRL